MQCTLVQVYTIWKETYGMKDVFSKNSKKKAKKKAKKKKNTA